MRGCPANLTPLYLARRHRASASTRRARKGADTYISDPAKPVTYRARPNLSPWANGSTWRFWLVDDQRFADARPDVLSYTSAPLTQPLQACRHAARAPRRLDQRHRQRLDRQADRRLPRPISAKAGAWRLRAGDRDGRDARPLPQRPFQPATGHRRTSRSPTNSRCRA